MKCPHCLTDFHDTEQQFALGQDADDGWAVIKLHCPACRRFILYLAKGDLHHGQMITIRSKRLFRPKGALRRPAPKEVPMEFAEDYTEACLVLPDSPKASAALSRRCLQQLLREAANVKPSDLSKEIQQVLDSGKLPSHIAEAIDAIRHTGNFAAHPIKTQTTGEIVPVEPGEAEWNLDVLESLFDFYFVQPALLKKKRDALNLKLKDVGKYPMK